MKKLKIFALVFSLIFCCFGLTGAVKVKNEGFSDSEKTYSIVLDYFFENSGMKYSEFKSQENPLELEENFELFKEKNKPTKENVANLLALYLMFNEFLNNAGKNISEEKKKESVFNVALNFFILTRLIGTTGEVCGLSKEELEWLEKNMTSESLRKVEITEEMLKKARKDVVKEIDAKNSYFNFKELKKCEEFKKLTKKARIKVEKDIANYIKNLEKIKNLVLNAKLEDVKKAVSNFKECGVRVVNVDTSKV